MATIAEIRSQYPQYSDMSDMALADAMHKKFYSDIPKQDFYAKVGIATPVAPTPTQTLLQQLNPMQGLNLIGRGIKAGVETIVEPIAAIGSGAIGAFSGPVIGAGKELLTQDFGKGTAEKTATEIQNALTYQPRSAGGQAVMNKLGQFMESDAGKIVQGLPVVGQELPMLGRAVSKQAIPVAATQYAVRQAEKAAELAAQSRLNAPLIDAAKAANKHGLAIDPARVNPTAANKVKSAAIGADEISAETSTVNVKKIPVLAKQELGLPADQPLNVDLLKKGRAENSIAHEKMSKVGMLGSDEQFFSDINSINRLEGLSPAEADFLSKSTPTLIAEIDAVGQQGFTGKGVVTLSRKFRKEANNIFKKTEPLTPEEDALATAKFKIANALDNLAERKLAEMHAADPSLGVGKLAKDLRNERAYIAKSYAYENALNDATQVIDASKLAKIASKDNALTGTLKDIAIAAANFPESFKVTTPSATFKPRATRVGVGGAIGFGLGSAVGAPFLGTALGAAGADVGRIIAGKRMATQKGQRAAVPMDYRSAREQMGYGVKQPEVTNQLSLAARGETIGGGATGGNVITPSGPYRGLLSLADEQRSAPQLTVQGIEYPLEPRLNPLYARGGVAAEPKLPSVNAPGLKLSDLPIEGEIPLLQIPKETAAKLPTIWQTLLSEAEQKSGTNIPLEFPTMRGANGTPLPKLPPVTNNLLSIADETGNALASPVPKGFDFTLRQEVMQQPAIVAAVDAFRQEAAGLQQIIDNAIAPKVRANAKLRLDALQKEFAAGMKMIGSETSADVHGLRRPMYESGRNMLPIQKTFSNKDSK